MSATQKLRRKAAAVALVLAVVALHGGVSQFVRARMAEQSTTPPMPSRLAVTFVRALQLAPPPVVAPAPAPARVKPKPKAPPVAPALPASAPAPEPKPEPLANESENLAEPPAAASAAVAERGPALGPEPTANAEGFPDAMGNEQPEAPTEEPFQWPPSTRLSYTLVGNYRGKVHGDAQVEWLRSGLHYQVNVDVSIGPSFAPLFTRRMTSEGELTADSLTPSRYDQETRKLFFRNRLTVLLGPDEIVLANGRRVHRIAGVQDSASQFVHLAALFTTRPDLLLPGTVVELFLALPRKVDLWVYEVVGEETLDTPFGPVGTFHLAPRRLAQRSGALTAEIWFAPQLRYLPVRIRIRQDVDTYIDLLISRLPDIAAQ